MENYSYSRLLLLTVCGLGLVFLYISWDREIYRYTFLKSGALLPWLLLSGLLMLGALLLLWRYKRDPLPSIKAWLSVVSVCAFLGALGASLIIYSVAWLTADDVQNYSARYEIAYSSKNSCSGIFVFDPQLQERIRICHPTYVAGGIDEARIVTRSNRLAVVVTGAQVLY